MNPTACPSKRVRARRGASSLESVLSIGVIAVICGVLMVFARQSLSNIVDGILFLVGCPWM